MLYMYIIITGTLTMAFMIKKKKKAFNNKCIADHTQVSTWNVKKPNSKIKYGVSSALLYGLKPINISAWHVCNSSITITN